MFNSVYVKKSRIHGKGLFAHRLIKKGEVIGVIEGRRVTLGGCYVLWDDYESGIRVPAPFKYINDSNKPNACYYDTMEVVALKDIKPHEEITHQYEQAY